MSVVKSKAKAPKQDGPFKGPAVRTETIQVVQKWLYSPDGKSCQMVESRPNEPYLTVDQNPNHESKLKSEGWVELDQFISLPKWMHAPDGKSGMLVETPAQYQNLQRHGWLDAPEGFHGTPEDTKRARAADQKALVDKDKAQTAANKDKSVADRKKAAAYAKMSPEDQAKQKEIDRNQPNATPKDAKAQKTADKEQKKADKKAAAEQKAEDKKAKAEQKKADKRAAILNKSK